MVTDHPEAYAEVAPQQNPNFELQRLENDVAVQVHINILNFYPSLHMPKHALGWFHLGLGLVMETWELVVLFASMMIPYL